MPVTSLGPLLSIVIVNITLFPTIGLLLSTILVNSKSETIIDVIAVSTSGVVISVAVTETVFTKSTAFVKSTKLVV